MKRIYITKVLETGYGVGVIPEMEKPTDLKIGKSASGGVYLSGESQRLVDDFNNHLASLPTFLVHPDFNPKEGEFIEQWREGEEVLLSYGQGSAWYNKDEVDTENMEDVLNTCPSRKVIYAPPEGNTPASEQGDDWDERAKSDDNPLFPPGAPDNYTSEEGQIAWQNGWIVGRKVLQQSPPSLHEREKGMKWRKLSEKKPSRPGFYVCKWYYEHTEVVAGVDYMEWKDGGFWSEDELYGFRWLDESDESQDTAKQSK